MPHDFNKPPHVITPEEKSQKRRLPVYILVIVGNFLIALLAYMFADSEPGAKDAPPGHTDPSAQTATPNNTTPTTGTATATDEAVTNAEHTATEASERYAITNAAANVGVRKIKRITFK